MKRCTIVGHNGWTDYISQYSLRRHFIQDYDECLLFIDSPDKYPFVKSLYPEDWITVCVPETIPFYDGIHTCLCCHTLGSSSQCPRSRKPCRFVDYTKYEGYTHILLNCFDEYPRWNSFYETQGFLTSMYSYYNLDPVPTIQKFKILLIEQLNQQFWNNLNIQEDFVAIHDNKSTGLVIQNPTSYKELRIDGLSRFLTDTVLTLTKAKEIHCIDSVYLFLICILSIQYGVFRDMPVHIYFRSLDKKGPFFAIAPYLSPKWTIHPLFS